MSQPTFTQKLTEYIHSGTACIFIQTREEARLDKLLMNLAKTEGFHIFEWNLGYGWVDSDNKAPSAAMNRAEGNNQLFTLSQSLTSLRDEELDHKLIVIKNAKSALAEDLHSQARLQFLINNIHRNHEGLCAVLLVSEFMQLPQEIETLTQMLPLPLPTRSEIGQQINELAAQHGLHINGEQLTSVCNACAGLTQQQISQVILRIKQRHSALDTDAITAILHEKENLISKSGVLEMVKANEDIDNLGGLEELKDWLRERAELIRQIEKLESRNIAVPKGVLIAGMPGCGKSLTAKVAANLFQLPLLRLDMGSLLGKYVGESESNMRRALAMAESISPCILWIDELEKAFTQTGGGSGASEVTSRMLGYFLTWMQDKSGAVFVIATANDITALPPELLRKGRFDEVFYVGFPHQQERESILRIGLQKSQQNIDALDLKALAAACRDYCGADIHNAVNLALEKTVLNDSHAVTQDDLRAAITATVPLSQSQRDKIQRYETLFEALKLRSASRQVSGSLAQLKKFIDDPNHLRRRELAEHPDCPETMHEKLIQDSEESVIEGVLKNPCCTGKILAFVITQCCPAEANQQLTETQKKFNDKFLELAARHPNVPLDLVEVMLEEKRLNPTLNLWQGLECNSSVTDKQRERLLRLSPELQIALSKDENKLKRAELAKFGYLSKDVQKNLAKDNDLLVRQLLARNTSLAQSTQDILAKDIDNTVLFSLAKNPAISDETQNNLAGDGRSRVRFWLAQNTRISREAQLIILQNSSSSIRVNLTSNPNRPPEFEVLLARDPNSRIREKLAENQKCHPDVQTKLARDSDPSVRAALAQNLNCSPDLQAELARDSDPDVRAALAQNLNCSPDLQAELARDSDPDIRAALAHNLNCSPDLQAVLAGDSDPDVRAVLAHNLNCSPDLQAVLAGDSDHDVRALLAHNLNCLLEAQLVLVQDGSSRVREILAANPSCQHAVQSILAKDSDRNVKEALVGNEKCSLEFQIALLKEASDKIRCQIASNVAESLELQIMLAKDENSDVRLALAKNSACIDVVQDILVNDDGDIREAIAANPNISNEAQYSLAMDHREHVRTALEYNKNVAPEIKELVSNTFSESPMESLRELAELRIAINEQRAPEISIERQSLIAVNGSSYIREMLARSTQYQETQKILAKDNRLVVRQALADNPRITKEVQKIFEEGENVQA